ncbi:MAG: protein-disulfide reductase DsbD domain-containing protein, partial [Moheibacter sp.]
MLKRTLFLLLLLPIFGFSQVLDPVKWSTGLKDLGNNEYEVLLNAKIDEGWHIYSQQHPQDGIGIPATIEFEANPNVDLIGKTKEDGKLLDRYSELFMQQEKLYENKVTFRQKIKLKEAKETTIKFSAESQVCDAEKCLPPDWKEFTVKITPKVVNEQPEEVASVDETPTEVTEVPVTDSIQSQIALNEKTDTTQIATAPPAGDDFNQGGAKKGSRLWEIFFLGVSGGLIALIMPCIFPMIPLTVSLFTKQKKQSKAQGIKKALIYGFSIVLIFVFLAAVATWAF